MLSSSSSSVQTAEEPTQYTLILYGNDDDEIATFKYIKTAEGKILSIAYQATGGPVYLMAEDMIKDLEAWIDTTKRLTVTLCVSLLTDCLRGVGLLSWISSCK